MAEPTRAERLAALKNRRESLKVTVTESQPAPVEPKKQEEPVVSQKKQEQSTHEKGPTDIGKQLGSYDVEYLGGVPVPKSNNEAAAHAAIDRVQEAVQPEKKVTFIVTAKGIFVAEAKKKEYFIETLYTHVLAVTLDPADKKILAFVGYDPELNKTTCHVFRVKLKGKDMLQNINKGFVSQPTIMPPASNKPTDADPGAQPWYFGAASKDACDRAVMTSNHGQYLLRDTDKGYAMVVNDHGAPLEFNVIKRDGKLFFGGHPHDDLNHFVSMTKHMKLKGRNGELLVLAGPCAKPASKPTVSASPLYGDNAESAYGTTAEPSFPPLTKEQEMFYHEVEKSSDDLYGSLPEPIQALSRPPPTSAVRPASDLYGGLPGGDVYDSLPNGAPKDALYGNDVADAVYGNDDAPGTELYGDAAAEKVPTKQMYHKFADDSSKQAMYGNVEAEDESSELYGNLAVERRSEGAAANLYGSTAAPEQELYGNAEAEGDDTFEDGLGRVPFAVKPNKIYSSVVRQASVNTRPDPEMSEKSVRQRAMEMALNPSEEDRKPVVESKRNSKAVQDKIARFLSSGEGGARRTVDGRPWLQDADESSRELAKHGVAAEGHAAREAERARRAEEAREKASWQILENKKEQERRQRSLEENIQKVQAEEQARRRRLEAMVVTLTALNKEQYLLKAAVKDLGHAVLRERNVTANIATKPEMKQFDQDMALVALEVVGPPAAPAPAKDDDFGFGSAPATEEGLAALTVETRAAIAALEREQQLGRLTVERLKALAVEAQAKRAQEKQATREELARLQAAREKDLQRLKEKQARTEEQLAAAAKEEAARKARDEAERGLVMARERERQAQLREQKQLAVQMKQAFREEEESQSKRDNEKRKKREDVEAKKKPVAFFVPKKIAKSPVEEKFTIKQQSDFGGNEVRRNPLASDAAFRPQATQGPGMKYNPDSIGRMWRKSYGLGL